MMGAGDLWKASLATLSSGGRHWSAAWLPRPTNSNNINVFLRRIMIVTNTCGRLMAKEALGILPILLRLCHSPALFPPMFHSTTSRFLLLAPLQAGCWLRERGAQHILIIGVGLVFRT